MLERTKAKGNRCVLVMPLPSRWASKHDKKSQSDRRRKKLYIDGRDGAWGIVIGIASSAV
jgi:hypothetical protein